MPVQTQTPTRACPKCGQTCRSDQRECPRCQVIIDKVAAVEGRRKEHLEHVALSVGTTVGRLQNADELRIKQHIERLEIFTGIETANHYSVMDGQGNQLFVAAEESGTVSTLLGRLFLKAARPFTLHVTTPQGDPVLTVVRPFRFFFHEVRVLDPLGTSLGSVERQWSWVNRIYHASNGTGQPAYEIFGPLFRPWTFHIRRGGTNGGAIRKRWAGLGREMFSDADCFGIEFPPGADAGIKAVLLGAVFLIDFAHFEDNQG